MEDETHFLTLCPMLNHITIKLFKNIIPGFLSLQPIEKCLFILTSCASHPEIGKCIHQMVCFRRNTIFTTYFVCFCLYFFLFLPIHISIPIHTLHCTLSLQVPSPLPPSTSTSTLYMCSIRYDGPVSEEYYLLFMIKPENICFLCSLSPSQGTPGDRLTQTNRVPGEGFVCFCEKGPSGKGCLFL